jgi:two-component sensor histidine kinase
LPATDFHHFFEGAEGLFWISTTQGLIKWDRSHHAYQQFFRANGLSNNNIYAAYPDDFGYIWLSSDYGIMKFNKATGVVKTYLTEDGITYKDDSGIIYFGSLNGITAFNPRSFAKTTANDKRQSPLLITSFQQFNGETNKLENRKPSLLGTNTITIKPQDRFFTLEFALINYSEPELTSYYWKIDGIDSGWNIQKDRTIRLSRLPYGERLLHIKAQESDGTWSANELLIQLKVVKPFYLNNGFIALVIAIIIALIILIYRWRVRFLQKENARLDATVTEKTKDLQQSLQQKGILLGEIHHRVKNNLQMICSLLELQSYKIVDEAAKVAFEESQSRVMSIAIIHEKLYQNELFNSLNFHAFIDDLFEQIKRISGDKLKGIELANGFPQKIYDIDVAVPLGLILNELITNSIKHAEPQKAMLSIRVAFRQEGKYSVIRYSDNGHGLPDGFDWKNSSSMGMQLVHMQSQQLGGHTDYSFDNGSVFTIYFQER